MNKFKILKTRLAMLEDSFSNSKRKGYTEKNMDKINKQLQELLIKTNTQMVDFINEIAFQDEAITDQENYWIFNYNLHTLTPYRIINYLSF